jgi:hypothetical protein
MTDPIRDELHRLSEEFRKLLGKPDDSSITEKTTVEQLVQCYGLTTKEAKEWLKKEPDFVPSDDSYHEPSNRRKVTRTCSEICANRLRSFFHADLHQSYI